MVLTDGVYLFSSSLPTPKQGAKQGSGIDCLDQTLWFHCNFLIQVKQLTHAIRRSMLARVKNELEALDPEIAAQQRAQRLIEDPLGNFPGTVRPLLDCQLLTGGADTISGREAIESKVTHT